MLEERIEDGAFLRLIKKWLQAGVLDTDGQVLHPTTGTPQGGIVSPVLANVYLHYALDLWFQKVIKPRCHGEACLLRFADDFVAAFQYQDDAERFYLELSQRLAKFGLELSAEKTRILPFSQHHPLGQSRFDFLGFEFRWDKDRAGKPRVLRRTSRKKLRNSLIQGNERQATRLLQLLWRPRQLCQPESVLSGGYADAVQVAQSSQSTSQLHLDRLSGTIARLSGSTTLHCGETQDEIGRQGCLVGRRAEASILEEPGARKPHARICAGAVG